MAKFVCILFAYVKKCLHLCYRNQQLNEYTTMTNVTQATKDRLSKSLQELKQGVVKQDMLDAAALNSITYRTIERYLAGEIGEYDKMKSVFMFLRERIIERAKKAKMLQPH